MRTERMEILFGLQICHPVNATGRIGRNPVDEAVPQVTKTTTSRYINQAVFSSSRS